MTNTPLRIDIPSPRIEFWDAMTGDDTVRDCSLCRKNMFNRSETVSASTIS